MEVLSQSQIDDLLNSLTAGAIDIEEKNEETGKKVKEYDFRTPKRFTKENLKVISSVYETFARLMSSYLTSMLRLYVEVECVHIEEQRYYEFNNALPDAVATGVGEIKYTGGSEENNTVIMDFSRPIVFAWLERLLGGTGDGIEVARDFTEIELALLDNIFKGAFPQMSDAWHNYFELDVLYRKIETNSRLMQAIGADETVVIVVLDIKMKELTGNINICVPAVCLEDVIKKLDNQHMRNLKRIHSSGDKERKEQVMNYLNQSTLEMNCIIGETNVELKEIIYLNVGDVIQLNKSTDMPVDLRVGETSWFKGKMGVQRGKKAVKIEEVL